MPKVTIPALCLLSMVGCVVDADDPSAPPDGDAVYTRTIVRTAADGSSTVTTEPITAAQELAEHEADIRALAAGLTLEIVSTDSCTDPYATKFFDQTNYTGNELCVLGSGPQYLDYFCRIRFRGVCFGSWDESTRSIWTGQSQLWIQSDPGSGDYCSDSLPAYEARASVSACIQIGDLFYITPQT
jgi:hypothetical protein